MSVKIDLNNNNSILYQSSNEPRENLFEILPDEIIQKIFFPLTDRELGACRVVCRDWQALASDESFLKSRYTEPAVAFGKEKWAHIGKVEEVPHLPDNIDDILESPCPIWEGKKIKETHVLVYKPQQVNDQPHTINNIGKLVLIEGKATDYRYIWDAIVNEHGNTPVEKGEWVLMTKDVLPGSRNKSYTEQQTLVRNLSEKAHVEYQVPKLIDAITCIFAEYVSSKTRLYSDTPLTYTRCQEQTKGFQLVVGGFAPGGLCVIYCHFVCDFGGVGVLRKF
jgi:hypothetical protein